MAVDEYRWPSRRAQPLAIDHRVAGRRDRAHRERTGERQHARNPLRGRGHIARVRRIGAHARNRRELDQLGENTIVTRLEPCENFLETADADVRHHLPPSIEMTW